MAVDGLNENFTLTVALLTWNELTRGRDYHWPFTPKPWSVPCFPEKIVHFLATEVSRETYVNIMDQYRPCYRAEEFDEINRPLSRSEYKKAIKLARQERLHRFDVKDMDRMLKLLLQGR